MRNHLHGDDAETLDGADVRDTAPEPEDEDECQRPAARNARTARMIDRRCSKRSIAKA